MWQGLTGTELWFACTPQGKPPLCLCHTHLVPCLWAVNFWALMPIPCTTRNHWFSTFLECKAPFSTGKKKLPTLGWDLCVSHQVEKSSRTGMECNSSLEPLWIVAQGLEHSECAIRKWLGWRGQDSCLFTGYRHADLSKSSIHRVLRKESTSLDLSSANPTLNWTEGLPTNCG